MNELYYFKKYLDEELRLAFSNKNPIESKDKTLDMTRITEIQITMSILREYENFCAEQR